MTIKEVEGTLRQTQKFLLRCLGRITKVMSTINGTWSSII